MRLRRTVPWVVVAVVCWFVAGPLGLVTWLVIGTGVVLAPRTVLALAALAPAALAILTLTEADTDTQAIRLFAAERPISHELGMVMVVVWFGAGIIAWRSGLDGYVSADETLARRRWVLALLLVVAAVVTGLTID